MLFTNLDTIARRWLLEKNLPIHFYLEALLHSTTGLRELSFDSLKIINTVNLTLNNYFAVDLPGDFVDDVGCFLPVGGLLQPVVKKDSITPLRNVDNQTGNFLPYTDLEYQAESSSLYGINPSWIWFWNVNDWGEPTGRYYGTQGGAQRNFYSVIKERRQIQFSEQFTSNTVVLMYISNGQSVDNATQVDSLSQAAIQSFISWKSSPNADIKDSYEAATFYNERRVLRARLNPLTISDIKNVIRHNQRASPKN